MTACFLTTAYQLGGKISGSLSCANESGDQGPPSSSPPTVPRDSQSLVSPAAVAQKEQVGQEQVPKERALKERAPEETMQLLLFHECPSFSGLWVSHVPWERCTQSTANTKALPTLCHLTQRSPTKHPLKHPMSEGQKY